MKSLILILIAGLLILGCTQTTQQTAETLNEESQILAGTTSVYQTFTQSAFEQAQADGKIILLFFYADWCPSCKAEQVETIAAFNELDAGNVIGFRVNYRDSSTDSFEEALAKEYGISYQHTKLIIKNGEQILKAPDSWKKDRYLAEIGEVL